MRPRDYFFLIARLLIGALFIYSGFLKLIQPIEYFEFAIGFYQIVPDGAIHYVALAISWAELISGAFFFLGYLYKPSAAFLILLTVLFQTAIGQAVFRRLNIQDCGCFGGAIHFSPCQTYVFDSVLLLVLIAFLFDRKPPVSADRYLLPSN